MRKLSVFFLVMFSAVSFQTIAQESWTYFVLANANLYVPGKGSQKQMYPILGYNREAQPKLLIGGLGAGLSAMKSVAKDLRFKGQLNLSKHSYWDEPFELRGSNNEPLGDYVLSSSDLSVALAGVIQYKLSDAFAIGAGIGAQMFTTTLSRTPKFEHFQVMPDDIVVNHYYKPFLPVLPVEASLTFKKMLLNLRYEHGLSNRYKKALAEHKTDRFGLLYFEVGFSI